MPDRPTFGRWLKERREALDLTQAALGARVGCASETIGRLEAERRRPSRELATRLAQQLELDHGQAERFVRLACSVAALAPDPRVPQRTPQVRGMPLPLTPLVGRATEGAALCELVEQSDVRLVTLVGPPGIGKTRLALQVAADLAPQFADGVVVVLLAAIATLASVAIAQALGAGEPEQPLLPQLERRLRTKHLLLVLDNFEHTGSAAALLVSELLRAIPGLTVLATSRRPLYVYGEHQYTVAPLKVPMLQPLPPLDTIADQEAVRLFVERAQAVQHDFRLTHDNVRTVVEICARLEGVPLAIELAAARLKLYPPHELLRRLSDPLLVLIGGPRDLPDRHRSLRAAINWSYELLPAGAQALLCRLAAFESGFTLEDVADLCSKAGADGDAAADEILALLDVHLLRQQHVPGGDTHYAMPDAVRAYALERTAEPGSGKVLDGQRAAPSPSVHVGAQQSRTPDMLTERELQVLRLLADGLTYDQIGHLLVISPRTVNRHLTSIYSKLHVSSRHAATSWALQHQLG